METLQLDQVCPDRAPGDTIARAALRARIARIIATGAVAERVRQRLAGKQGARAPAWPDMPFTRADCAPDRAADHAITSGGTCHVA